MATLADKLKRVIAAEAIAWVQAVSGRVLTDKERDTAAILAAEEYDAALFIARIVVADKARALLRGVNRAVRTGTIPERFDRADGLGELIATGLGQFDPRVAFQASLRSAYAAGREDRIDRDETITHVVRRTMLDARVRSSHRVLEGLVLPKADRARDGLYAPLGWRCRCKDIGIDQEGIDRLQARGVKLQFEVPELRQVTHVNKFTGEKESLPECTEPGWGKKQNTPAAQESLAEKLRLRMQALGDASLDDF